MERLKDIADIAASVATVAGFVGVLLGLYLGWRQFRLSQRLNRELSAKVAFTDFLTISLAHPNLAQGDRRSPVSDEPASSYLWYSRLMLMSFENVLVSCNEAEWKAAVRMHLHQHLDLLGSDEFVSREKACYDPVLVSVINQVLAMHPNSLSDSTTQ